MADDQHKNREDQAWTQVKSLLGEAVISTYETATLEKFKALIQVSTRNGTDVHSPVRELMSLLGDRWAPLLLALLHFGSLRFSTLQRIVGVIDEIGISRRMLSFTLRALEREGLVARRVITNVPPNVEYSLTELGNGLCSHLLPLLEWGEQRCAVIEAARKAFADKDAS